MEKDTLIKIRSLSKSFDKNIVLDSLDLNVYKNSSLIIMGSSGSGKSVLIKTIMGLIQKDKGTVTIKDCEDNQLLSLGSKCSFLFQGGALFDSLNVWENITFYASKHFKLNTNQAKELAAEKLKSVGLKSDIINLYSSELSGGMQKRVALARAISVDPEIIFFDEPTTGLDPIMVHLINDLLIKIREELKATTITITHDVNTIKNVGTEVAMLYLGKIIWHDDVEELANPHNKIVEQFIKGEIEGPIKI